MKKVLLASLVLAYIAAFTVTTDGQATDSGPRYVNGMNLARPADYREWVYLSSGLGMEYNPVPGQQQGQSFGNVFVNPSSYRAFMKTGKWPDRTVFVLEFRASKSEGSINKAGRFQGDLVGLEAEVKDARFPDGWGFFNFSQKGTIVNTAEPLPLSAGCAECHTKNTAVERTFVQFYPTLMEVARKMGTVNKGF
ncbi:MAG TPA: cytochrome P460 family protein [Vicinamibacterales bacterium]|nr:cytochrome P460 family protein [Vicinamibacterales bacterium]